jgi:O-succinylbenzoic acid--CoA ligase
MAARQFGNLDAIRSSDARLTYADLDRAARRLTAIVRDYGVQPGVRVGLRAVTEASRIGAFWALLRCGATTCLINPKWPSSAIDSAMRLAGADRMLSESHPSDWLSCIRSHEDDRVKSIPLIDAAPASVLFTSGSSGTAKAVAHELSAHLASAQGANDNLPLTTGDAWLLSLPLFHVSGLGILFRCVVAGATLIVPSGEHRLHEQMDRYHPSHVSLVPTQLSRLLDHYTSAPSYLRAVLLGGGPLPNELIERARRTGWPLLTTYGLTEMASQVTTSAPGAGDDELRTAGRVLRGREVRITADGEIVVRGETLFCGYVNGHSLTCPWDADGWFATGDLGAWDAAGRLIVLGRRDNCFISGGENIYPEEIERVLLDQRGVRQAIVVPVADERFGQRPVAFVEGDAWEPDEWCKALALHLPRFKLPDRFLAWPDQVGLKPHRPDFQRLAEECAGR